MRFTPCGLVGTNCTSQVTWISAAQNWSVSTLELYFPQTQLLMQYRESNGGFHRDTCMCQCTYFCYNLIHPVGSGPYEIQWSVNYASIAPATTLDPGWILRHLHLARIFCQQGSYSCIIGTSGKDTRGRLNIKIPSYQYMDLKIGRRWAHLQNRVYNFILQWRHNGRDNVSYHQPQDCLLNRLFKRRSKKTSKLRLTGLCAGNSSGTGEFTAQMASYAENVSIWWRHHHDSKLHLRSSRAVS